jgi:hypothetical protein
MGYGMDEVVRCAHVLPKRLLHFRETEIPICRFTAGDVPGCDQSLVLCDCGPHRLPLLQSPVVCMLRPFSEESIDITFFSLGGRFGVCEADLLLYFGAAQRRGVRLVAETAVPTVDIRHRGVSVSSTTLQLCNVSVGQTVSEALTIVNTSRVRFTCRLQVRFLLCISAGS